ncbi:MAG: alpha/beta hydrolase family protein [Candidatus Geothermincolia bacterium]
MRFIFRTLKRLVGVGVTLAAILVGSVLATHFWMRLKFHAMLQRGVPEGPDMEIPVDRDMASLVETLREVPFKGPSANIPGYARGAAMNSFLLFLNAARATSGIMYPYPEQFEHVVIESFDGTPISAAVGIHKDKPRPAIVMSHGFMGSKNDHYIIETALTAFSEWGFNVLGIDLRNFGRSQSLSHGPTTAGWKESEDLLAAAKYLSERPEVTSVGITGFSMGAGSTMVAAARAAEFPYLTGGAIAWNGYADARRMIEYISTRPPLTDPFMPVYWAFRLMHKVRREDMKNYIDDPELLAYLDGGFESAGFKTYVEKIAAPHYGLTLDEYFEKASPANYMADVKVPLLVIHAEDDMICLPSEMDEVAEAAAGNPNVQLMMLPAGNHCMFRYLDKDWYDKVMRDFFTYWATW